MPLVAGNNEVPTIINTPFIPKEGPRDLPILFDFSANASYTMDLLQQVQNSQFSRAQTIFVDNSQNTTGPVTITWQGTGQVVQIPPGWQAYVPVLVTQRPIATVASTGNGKCFIHVLNVPISPAAWPATQTTPLFNANGYLEVTDVALDAVVTAAGVKSIAYVNGSGDIIYPRFKTQNAISGLTQGAIANILVGNPGFFVNFVDISLSSDASLGAAVINATTWDPANTSNQVVLSGGNLTMVPLTGGATGAGRSLASFSTGKYYVEQTWTFSGNATFDGFGVCNSTFNVTSGTPSSNMNAVVALQTGAIQVAGVSQGTLGGALVTSNILGMAVDFGAKLIWYRIGAGNWNNNAANNPATGVGGISIAAVAGPYYALGAVGTALTNTLTANFGATAFANAAPSGFNDMGTTTGGSQGITISLMDGTRTISTGYTYVGAVQNAATAGIGIGSQITKLDQLNYDSKVNNSTLSLSVTGGGINQTLVTGNIIYNIGAGQTNTVN